jgi:RuvB-like protein 2
MLDLECFSFLNRALESDLAPVLVVATNRGVARVRGGAHRAPHGIPVDLLDRLLIINTVPYTEEEMRAILGIRFDEEDVRVGAEAADLLTKVRAALGGWVVVGRWFSFGGRCCATYLLLFTKPNPTTTPPAPPARLQIATETSLRYAIQLIATAAVSAGRRKAPEVGTEDVAKAYSLFLDVRRSVQLLHEHADEYVGNEAAGGGGAGMDVA